MDKLIPDMTNPSPISQHHVAQAFNQLPLSTLLAPLNYLSPSHLRIALTWTTTHYQALLDTTAELSFIITDIRRQVRSLHHRDIDEHRADCSMRFEAAAGGATDVLEADLLEVQGAIEGLNQAHVEEVGAKEGEMGLLVEKLERSEWRIRMLLEEVARLKREIARKDAQAVRLREKKKNVGLERVANESSGRRLGKRSKEDATTDLHYAGQEAVGGKAVVGRIQGDGGLRVDSDYTFS